MAFDLKGATPDTTFAIATAFLFGADSQSATDPSIFAASTIFNALVANPNIWTAPQVFSPSTDLTEFRRSTNVQVVRIYGTYTDASNYEALELTTAGSTMSLRAAAAGTGVGRSVNIRPGASGDVTLQDRTAATRLSITNGFLNFGAFSALASEVITGYLTIKDLAGNSRKLAVIA